MLDLTDRKLTKLEAKHIPTPKNIKHIDLSGNQLSKGFEFTPLCNLSTLIIDDNAFTVLTDFPVMRGLETFSGNKNVFSDLELFVKEASDRFPNLKNLSTLKNPMNPFFQGEHKYNIYRDRVLRDFPDLMTLDGCPISVMKKDIRKRE